MVSFSKEECIEIINLSGQYTPCHSSTIFTRKDYDYYFHVLVRDKNTQWIFDRIRNFLNKKYPDNISHQMPAIFLHRYLKGNKFARHNDSTNHPDQVLNVGVCLNTNYKEGNFLVYNPNEIIPKEVGLIYTLESNRDHEITEITEGERWSLIIFFNKIQLLSDKSRVI